MRLVANGVAVRYPGSTRVVLSSAHLVVDEGETVAVLGPSGSGKSTLLSVLGGLIQPTRGTAHVETSDGSQVRMREACAWVLQTVNVLPERSALANVAIAGMASGLSRRAAMGDAALRLSAVGLDDRAQEPARVLSGGELQRVVIARALASRRPFILADEPTGQLDRATSDAVLDALFNSTCGAGVVVVTHDPVVAERCGRVVRIDDGVAVPV